MTEEKKKRIRDRRTGRPMGRPRIPTITPDLGAADKEGKIPPKPIDIEQVFHWMDLGATQEEIAGSFRVSVDTLYARLKEFTGHTFSELKEKVCGGTKIELRKNQFNLSKTNAAMCIWLGKNWLGQRDQTQLTDDDVKTFSDIVKAIKNGSLEDLITQKD